VRQSYDEISYFMLVTKGNEQRMENAARIKMQIPELRVIPSTMEDVFQNAVDAFDLPDGFCGAVMLEDDIMLCRDFKRRLEGVLEAHMGETVSFFESACSKNELKSEYRAGIRFMWNQCNFFPKPVCDVLCDKTNELEFEEWYFRKYDKWTYPIDTYIGYTLDKMGLKYWMEVPFLVQHMPWESAVGKRPKNRQSKYFVDDMEKL
jgi:hypothetical protein